MGVGLGMAVLAAAGLSMGTSRARAAEEPDRGGERRVERNHVFVFGGGAHLGVTLDDVTADDVTRLKLDEEQGAVVKSVAPDSPAAKAGLQKGDVVVRYQGETVHSAAQLARLVRETPSGRKVSIEVSRDGAEQRLTATLEGGRGHHPFGEDFNFALPEPPDPPDTLEPPDAPEAPHPPRAPHAPHAPHAPGAMGRFAIPFPPELDNLDLDMEGMFPPDGDAFREVFRAGRPRRLGISYEELGDQLAAYFKAPEGSVLVTRVDPEGSAGRAGLKAGDVILKFNGKKVEGRELREAVDKAEAGSEVTLTVQRDGRTSDLRVTLPKKEEHRALHPGETT
jgi:membrane-associated protease RseP (regulator of RpoE activity)